MSGIPEYGNCYAGLCCIHTCSLDQPDDIERKTQETFIKTPPEQRNLFFLMAPPEIRTTLKGIAERSILSHRYLPPEGYKIGHIVKDLIALYMACQQAKQPHPQDPPIKFNAEKQTFWLCQQFLEQTNAQSAREEYREGESDR